jgi:hypothetical protein
MGRAAVPGESGITGGRGAINYGLAAAGGAAAAFADDAARRCGGGVVAGTATDRPLTEELGANPRHRSTVRDLAAVWGNQHRA